MAKNLETMIANILVSIIATNRTTMITNALLAIRPILYLTLSLPGDNIVVLTYRGQARIQAVHDFFG
jgi:hypothetical protein